VTPDGRRAVSVSADKTLKVWDLDSHACLFTHYTSTGYTAVTATATAIIAGDLNGAVWFLGWLPSRAIFSSPPRTSALATTNAASRRGVGRRMIAVVARFLKAVLALARRASGR
jgi:WD40 repeat protein